MIDFLQNWQVFLVPLCVVIITQIIKLLVESVKHGFQWEHINSYGGMPSAHTASFVSLTLMVGFVDGFSTPLFAVTAFISAVFIRDAVGLRWYLGQHGKVLNTIIEDLPAAEQKKLPKHLKVRLGHTYGEMCAGFVIGVLLTVLLYLLIN